MSKNQFMALDFLNLYHLIQVESNITSYPFDDLVDGVYTAKRKQMHPSLTKNISFNDYMDNCVFFSGNLSIARDTLKEQGIIIKDNKGIITLPGQYAELAYWKEISSSYSTCRRNQMKEFSKIVCHEKMQPTTMMQALFYYFFHYAKVHNGEMLLSLDKLKHILLKSFHQSHVLSSDLAFDQAIDICTRLGIIHPVGFNFVALNIKEEDAEKEILDTVPSHQKVLSDIAHEYNKR